MSVYIDTSAIIAIMDVDDPRHKDASKAWLTIIESDEEVVTSTT